MSSLAIPVVVARGSDYTDGFESGHLTWHAQTGNSYDCPLNVSHVVGKP